MLYFLVLLVMFYILYDVNYFVRTYFTVLSGRLYQRNYTLDETTTIFGLCTFQDCDVSFRCIREARLLRELDFARYHFYDRTGVYQRSRDLRIKSLQGCTLTLTMEPVPLFSFYKINTKLVYWDERSLFFEHEVITLHDGKVRAFLVSRQHAIGENGDSSEVLLGGLPGSQHRRECPEYLKHWFRSMEVTSEKLRHSR
ncbi:protein THEM6-like [Pectinophora gossypiella]|uniref:protein THEM6-like n=1 Tax=Pectinophora gossypiella TaxID=13191 RepID=UPI00214EE6F3|nr:protein THEM6-like [Pectinophora gossypiella]